MSDSTDPNTPIAEQAAPAPEPVTFFGKLKASVLKIETEALEEAHATAVAALHAEHVAIIDVEQLFARIRAKV